MRSQRTPAGIIGMRNMPKPTARRNGGRLPYADHTAATHIAHRILERWDRDGRPAHANDDGSLFGGLPLQLLSKSQLAALATFALDMERQKRRVGRPPKGSPPPLGRATVAVAAAFGISAGSIYYALRIRRESPRAFGLLLGGKISLQDARALLPPRSTARQLPGRLTYADVVDEFREHLTPKEMRAILAAATAERRS